MLRLEEEVNRIISQDLPVTMSYITQEEAKQFFDLNRLPDDASDTVRVVKIGDYDQCLCIGAHVEHTSEIGTFKLLSYSFSEGVLRLRWKVVQ
jgi:alanyl-tRNA synthetase